MQELQRHQNVEEGVESQENKSLEKLLKDTLGLIDTTLLKCYIKVGGAGLRFGWGWSEMWVGLI